MESNPVKDKFGAPKMKGDGSPQVETYIAIAIAKGTETAWAQTEWGAVIYKAGAEGWPQGEYKAPAFAWKVIDGDSAVPNQKGKAWNAHEGFPGHWILRMSSGFGINCFHAAKHQPHEQIQDKLAIKRGDYCRVVLNTVGNNPSQSPGVYLNPQLFELVRAGIEIISTNAPDAVAAFAQAAVLPTDALVDTSVAAPETTAAAVEMPPGVEPAPDFLTPDIGPQMTPAAKSTYKEYTAGGWTDAMLIEKGYMVA